MEELEGLYNDLETAIHYIDITLLEIENKDIKERLEVLKYEFLEEKQDTEPQLYEMQEQEERYMHYEYERGVL